MYTSINIREIRFGEYARKSSESEDRQMQSIQDQRHALSEIARRESLNITRQFPGESETAFKPGRPIFAEVIKSVEKGEIDGLLIWHTNRLSRNSVDAGAIVYLMDQGKLQIVKTASRHYYNTPDDKFSLQLDLSCSKRDSDDKSIVVKRGQVGKARRGVPHGVAYIGFLNDKTEERGNRNWKIDETRLPLVKQMLKEFLKGKHSVAGIHRYATEELKLTTPIRKKSGGKLIAASYTYLMLRNPVYAGFFYQNDEMGQLKRFELQKDLPRLITEDEYWRMQSILGAKGRPRPQKHEGLYNHIMRDEEGGTVTPDYKFQLICDCKHKFSYSNVDRCPKCGKEIERMEGPKYLSYTYYYSTKARKRGLRNAHGIEEAKITSYLLNYFSTKLNISEELSRWCIQNLETLKDVGIGKIKGAEVSKQEAEGKIQKMLNSLLDLRLSAGDNASQEDVERWDAKEKKLKADLSQIRGDVTKDNFSESKLEEVKKRFSLLPGILETLENGTREEKRDVLIDFGSNLTLKEKSVSIYNAKEVELFIKALNDAKTKNPQFEPKKCLVNKEETDVFDSVSPILLRG